jgi:flagellar protein FliS
LGHRYLQIEVATARPEVLVARLLQRALEKIREADGRGEGVARSRALAQAIDIVSELRRALDLSAGGEIAANLDRLYDFAAARLLSAGATRESGALEDAIHALEPIVEAFAAVAQPPHTGGAT